jgi:hypothetical protein
MKRQATCLVEQPSKFTSSSALYQNGVGSCKPLVPLHQRSNSPVRAKLNSIHSTLQDMTPTEYNVSVTHITVIITAHFALCPASRHARPQQAVLVRYDEN